MKAAILVSGLVAWLSEGTSLTSKPMMWVVVTLYCGIL
jgi:hypothetical protein